MRFRLLALLTNMKKGFTLIELLVVIALAMLLVTIVSVSVRVMMEQDSYDYRICNEDSDCIYGNDIEYRDNCAVNEEDEAICGNFTIKSLKKDEASGDKFE